MELNNTQRFQQYFQTKNRISIANIIFNQRDELIKLRRHFHRHPELSYKEYETAKYIENYLQNLSAELIIKTNIAKTGITALLVGQAGKGKCIALRADIDALPVQEIHDIDPEYKSVNDGVSHCCGHDCHIAILLVTAKVLCSMKSKLYGSVKFIFQPAEEGGAGAKVMVDQGVLDNPPCDQVYGLHVTSTAALGSIGINCEPKPMMAGCASFDIDVIGVGGHGAMPHASKDAIVACASLIQQIHTIVSRNISPNEMGVISIGKINSGYKDNVISDKAQIAGTMRWYNDDIGNIMKKRLKQVCDGIQESFEVTVKLSLGDEYPPVFNHKSGHKIVCDAARKIVGDGLNDNSQTVPASEDFSYYLLKRPGAYFFVGGKVEDGKNKLYMHHIADFKIDERCLVIGCQIFVQIISDLLITNYTKSKL